MRLSPLPRPRALRDLLPFAAAAVAALTAAACGGSGNRGQGAAASNVDLSTQLMGEYVAASVGPIVSLSFYQGNAYALVHSDCGDAASPCTSTGSYEATDDSLTLTDGTTHDTRSFALSDLKRSDGTELSTSSLSVLDDLVNGSGGSLISGSTGGSLTNSSGGSLTSSAGGSTGGLVTPAAPLVTCQSNCVMTFGANGQLVQAAGNGVTVQPSGTGQ